MDLGNGARHSKERGRECGGAHRRKREHSRLGNHVEVHLVLALTNVRTTMASVASPLSQLGMARPSPQSAAALPDDVPRIPEVLVVCLVHDSPSLRARWPELLEAVLSPLFCRYVALQGDSRLLVGGVVYRSASAAELVSPLRLDDAVVRIPFLPTPRFIARVAELFGAGACVPAACVGDSSEAQSMLVDGVAAALEMLSSRDVPKQLPQWAQAALQAHHSPVSSRHVVHIVASHDASVPAVPPLHPVLNSASDLDALGLSDMASVLAKRSIGVCTVASAGTRGAGAMIKNLHAMLAPPDGEDVDVQDLMGEQWKAPSGIDVRASGIALGRASSKRQRAREEMPSAKRAKAAAPAAPAAPAATPAAAPAPAPASAKLDQKSVNKIYLLQQQLATMLKNLAHLAGKTPTAGIQRSLHTQMIDQIKQQLVAQQNAIRAQAEVLRGGRQPNLNVILQALINIDKEAKESGLHLGGPSSAVARAAKATTRTQGAQPVPFWQGLLRWNFGPGGDSFALVAASASAALQPDTLALPWPDVFVIKTLIPVSSQELQRFIVKNRVPCILLSLRAIPPTIAVRGADNDSNYRMLATLLERNQRVAYVPHGGTDCGLLLAALPTAAAGNTAASRLIALVFSSPIPFDQLSPSALNRGVMPTIPGAQAPAQLQTAMPGMQFDLASLQSPATPGVPMGAGAFAPSPLKAQAPLAMPNAGLGSPFSAAPANTFSSPLGTGGQGLAFTGMPSANPLSSAAGLAVNPLFSSVPSATQPPIPNVATMGLGAAHEQPGGGVFSTDYGASVDQLRAMGLL